MNEEFVNSYIENLNKMLNDTITNLVMANTRLSIAERTIKAFGEENQQLKNENERLTASLNKKAAKSKEDF